jgi:hypothetical protein
MNTRSMYRDRATVWLTCLLIPLFVVRTVLTRTRVHRRISFARLRQGRDLLTLFASGNGS